MKLRALILALCLTACSDERPMPAPQSNAKPVRIVSLDFCADQYALKLADRKNILALSYEARLAHSYLREAAKGLPTFRPGAEQVLALEPDLILRSYGGGPNAERFYESAGIRVLTIEWAGNLEAIKTVTKSAAAGLGEPERGKALVDEMEARLTALSSLNVSKDKTILYMTPTGVTTGSGSLIHALILEAGLTNFEPRPGWHPLPLERLTYERPDMVATSFYDTTALAQDVWSAARHPVARQQIQHRQTVQLPGAWTACGGWFALDAVEALAKAGAQ